MRLIEEELVRRNSNIFNFAIHLAVSCYYAQNSLHVGS